MQLKKTLFALALIVCGAGAIPVAAQTTSAPYSGAPIALPATFEASKFDNGGQNVAYKDLVPGNAGGQFRTTEDVDIIASTDTVGGPYAINNFQTGEWLAYTVNVPSNGNYDLAIRASSNMPTTGTFHMEVDGANVTGSVSVPNTGGWSTFQWFGKQNVALTAGNHVIKVVSDQQYFNMSAVRAVLSASQPTTPPPAAAYTGTPYSGTPIDLPKAFEASKFDKGGEGVAYHDLIAGNAGGQFRLTEDVDIIASTDTAGGPYAINNFQTGEWLAYTVNVPSNGNYDLSIRAASNMPTTGTFHMEVDGANVTGSVSVPNTGGWSSFQWFGKQNVALTAGKHVVKVVSDQQYFNMSAVSVLASAASTTTTGGTTTGGTTTGGTTTGGTTTGGTTTGGTTTGGTTTKPASMLFWSGFEDGVSVGAPRDCYAAGCWQSLLGTDSASGFTWSSSIAGMPATGFQVRAGTGANPTPSTITDYIVNDIQTVTGRTGAATRAQHTVIKKTGCTGTASQNGVDCYAQDPYLLQPTSEPGDMYISFWRKLDPTLLQKLVNGWHVVFEWKSTGDYRVSAQIVNYGGVTPYWQLSADNVANGGLPEQEFWRVNNQAVRVPIGEWFKFEVFWHRSKGADGRVWMAVNGQKLVDKFGPNYGVNGDPIDRIFLTQLYSAATYPLEQWTDDMQIWSGFPSAKAGDPWYDGVYGPH